MSFPKPWPVAQLWPNDEEMAKKDDDHRHGPRRASSHWSAVRPPRPACAVRLVVYLLAVAALVFLLLHALGLDHASDSDDGAPTSRSRYMPGLSSQKPLDLPPLRRPPPLLKPPKPGPPPSLEAKTTRNYNEPVTQPALIESLRTVRFESPGSSRNRNVLFAAASLQSAAMLLPLACQMASARLNQVHFLHVGRDDIPLDRLLKINGIDSACSLTMIDGRPDKAAVSTEQRMTQAVERALGIFHRIASPQAVLVDSTSAEEHYFLVGVRIQAKKMQTALIELPENPQSRLAWITKLDASALAAWNKVRFDIVVHAPRTGTGNLKRLLRSLARTDLGGHSIPRLVVELPSTVEEPLEQFLAGYEWPASSPGQKPMASMLSLHRRIQRQKLTEQESSARSLESFWPSDPVHSHVLVLSPHMEVSPHFFHYVKYALLFQRHSRAGAGQNRRSTMMGLSFSLPTTVLGSSRPFAPPSPLEDGEARSAAGTAFLWQAPVSDALLVLGEKWVELHGYVSQVLERQQAASVPPAVLASKEVGKQYPAWMEYALQLSRLRGYLTLYPSRKTADAIAGTHSDLPETPEEFQGQTGARDKKRKVAGDEASTVFDIGSQGDMLERLPAEGQQQMLGDLPVLSWDGKQTRDDAVEEEAMQFTSDFRQQVGSCSDDDMAKLVRVDKHAGDLFCREGTDRG